MRDMHARAFLFVLGFLSLAVALPTDAQVRHRWGVGGFAGYSIPVLGMGERFSGTGQYGGTWQYEYSPKLLMEIEYHHSEFKDGKEAKRAFFWPVDKKEHFSPLAVSQIKFNSVLLNLLLTPKALEFRAKQSVYYFTVGTGVYHYKAERRNFIYPGQTTAPLDETLYLRPQIDERAALGVNAGFGGQVFIGNNFALDLRARYHLVVGELRPMAAWGFDGTTMSLQLIEVSAGLKFYLQRS